MIIEKEDFEQWLAHPVTEEVFRALKRLGEQSKQKWIELSWDGGNVDPLMLADLRARAQIVNDLCELKFEEIQEDDEKRDGHSPD